MTFGFSFAKSLSRKKCCAAFGLGIAPPRLNHPALCLQVYHTPSHAFRVIETFFDSQPSKLNIKLNLVDMSYDFGFLKPLDSKAVLSVWLHVHLNTIGCLEMTFFCTVEKHQP